MPELPDLAVYIERLQAKVLGRTLQRVRVLNPFVVRTAVPPVTAAEGQRVEAVERLGKRIVFVLGNGHCLVIHLMLAGRLRWLPRDDRPAGKPPGGKLSLASFAFDDGLLVLTEAGTTRRASIHLLVDRSALRAADPGGMEVMGSDRADFTAQLRRENHTLKRALTMPQLFAGIGNAYSDEILHRARLSPVMLTKSISDDEIARLHAAMHAVITEWTDRLRAEAGDWPQKVTAFHPQMAVHGRYRLPCPDCGTPVQRIVQGDNESNYCARCQTGGRLLADRALSRLLKASWPKSVDDL